MNELDQIQLEYLKHICDRLPTTHRHIAIEMAAQDQDMYEMLLAWDEEQDTLAKDIILDMILDEVMNS